MSDIWVFAKFVSHYQDLLQCINFAYIKKTDYIFSKYHDFPRLAFLKYQILCSFKRTIPYETIKFITYKKHLLWTSLTIRKKAKTTNQYCLWISLEISPIIIQITYTLATQPLHYHIDNSWIISHVINQQSNRKSDKSLPII